ncbi:deubiquitinase OTUD6B-like [Mya arenaria]|uniref:deubiquitinase OTUD6B-like n=1 Tax=Mya arenaria TaxID=6604 RepID=UPI0022E06C95|nr:deubiquitinase OTUD6B-like [Mya arenaria]
MADADDEKCDAETLLIRRQRKEKKDLQGDIQKLKSGISKGDKKKKKEVSEKIALLEAELSERHDKELKELQEQVNQGVSPCDPDVVEAQQGVAGLAMSEHGGKSSVIEDMQTSKKPSKAQKRRAKKAAADQEREDRIHEQEIENLTSSRNMEAVRITGLLSTRGLQIHEIPSDGNCLYAAICHQMKSRKLTHSVDSLRSKVAAYMREHAADFMPFLTTDSGDCFTDDDFEKYCVELETTPAWGGQLEIQALCEVLKVPIEVVQSEGPPLVTGEQFQDPPVILTYLRHAYGLGEHYHSVEEKQEDTTDDFT